MSTNPRSEEFSLNSRPENPSTSPETPETLDWAAWQRTRKKMSIPALPFPPEQVFLPGETKTLHLFEARYLALFEHVVLHCDKRCAHVLIDFNRQAMAAFGVIVHIRSWRRLDVGVSVDIEAVGRLKSCRIRNPAPYLHGEFEPVDDLPLPGADHVTTARRLLDRFWPAFREVVQLSLKLGEDPIREKVPTASKTNDHVERGQAGTEPRSVAGDNAAFAPSQGANEDAFEEKLKQVARRAVNFEHLEFTDDADDHMVVRQAHALSFAGWDFFPSHYGLRQRAIEGRDTLYRLTNVVAGLEEYRKQLAAKLAVQSAFSK